MPRFLVVYYSLTGNTEKVAKTLSDRLGGDLEKIVELRPRTGQFARFWYAFDSIFRRQPPIGPPKHDVGDYDVIVLGSPVWAADMSAPMRSFLAREKGRIGQAAFFCTEIGAGGEIALERMAEGSAADPLAILLLTEKDLKGISWRSSVEDFARDIEEAALKSRRSIESHKPETPLMAQEELQ
jgi:flavodoxin